MELGKAVQMFGVVYAQPLGDYRSVSLRCPLQIIGSLADELLLSRGLREQLSDSDRHLLASFRSACSYLLDWSLDGAPFEELAFLSELCRQDVIAAGKTQV
jgi:hypothetical protein